MPGAHGDIRKPVKKGQLNDIRAVYGKRRSCRKTRRKRRRVRPGRVWVRRLDRVNKSPEKGRVWVGRVEGPTGAGRVGFGPGKVRRPEEAGWRRSKSRAEAGPNERVALPGRVNDQTRQDQTCDGSRLDHSPHRQGPGCRDRITTLDSGHPQTLRVEETCQKYINFVRIFWVRIRLTAKLTSSFIDQWWHKELHPSCKLKPNFFQKAMYKCKYPWERPAPCKSIFW